MLRTAWQVVEKEWLEEESSEDESSEEESSEEKPSEEKPSEEESSKEESSKAESSKEEKNPIKCICGFSGDNGDTVLCDKCGFWQHIVCYYESLKHVPNLHECTDCTPRPVDSKGAYNHSTYATHSPLPCSPTSVGTQSSPVAVDASETCDPSAVDQRARRGVNHHAARSPDHSPAMSPGTQSTPRSNCTVLSPVRKKRKHSETNATIVQSSARRASTPSPSARANLDAQVTKDRAMQDGHDYPPSGDVAAIPQNAQPSIRSPIQQTADTPSPLPDHPGAILLETQRSSPAVEQPQRSSPPVEQSQVPGPTGEEGEGR
jgi:hypothetical protein